MRPVFSFGDKKMADVTKDSDLDHSEVCEKAQRVPGWEGNTIGLAGPLTLISALFCCS